MVFIGEEGQGIEKFYWLREGVILTHSKNAGEGQSLSDRPNNVHTPNRTGGGKKNYVIARSAAPKQPLDIQSGYARRSCKVCDCFPEVSGQAVPRNDKWSNCSSNDAHIPNRTDRLAKSKRNASFHLSVFTFPPVRQLKNGKQMMRLVQQEKLGPFGNGQFPVPGVIARAPELLLR